MRTRGRLITLEGGEGAGKSTQARFIKTWLEQQGRQVLLTREPGGSPQAEAIRELILQGQNMPPMTELLLMFAARAAHLRDLILPVLASGRDVVCDRFVDSSYAYQGAGKNVPAAQIAALERMVLGRLKPDLVLVFDLPVELGLARARARGRGQQNRFEDETRAFMQRVRACFLKRARAAPRRYAVMDAARTLAHVQAQVARILEQRL